MYRELDIQDTIQRQLVPDNLGKYLDDSMSINITGARNTGEGPDFRLEEINRNVQRFMPLAPKESDWLKVCANFDTLMDIKRSLVKDKSLESILSTSSRKRQSTKEEELSVRVMFRKIDYLSNPELKRTAKTVTGELLDEDIVKFCSKASDNRRKYIEFVVAHNSARNKNHVLLKQHSNRYL